MTTNLFRNDGEMPAKLAAQLRYKAKTEMRFDADLAFGLDFTTDDLAANRAGVISARQLALLGKKHRNFTRIIGAFSLVLLIAIGTLIRAHAGRDPVLDQLGFFIFLFLLSTVYVMMIAAIWGNSPSLVMDLSALQTSGTESLSGRVILEIRGAYRLIIGQQTFRLERDAYLRFKHLDHYTIYYAPRSKVVLSAEPMTE